MPGLSLKDKLAKKMKWQRFWAKWDFALSQILLFGSILSSLGSGAGAIADLDGWPGKLGAALALVPALFVTTEAIYKFGQRAAWHEKKYILYEGKMYQLLYENAADAQVSAELRAIDEQLENEWNALLGTKPAT